MRPQSVAIIPARGGSKRIPRKNIIDFAGKPMIAYSIEAATATGLFSTIVVSTDDDEIAAVARQYGADVPFMRPAALADDYADTGAVLAHAIGWLEAQGTAVENACCIYATAPFVRSQDIIKGHARLIAGDWDYVFSAGLANFPVFRSFQKQAAGGLEMLYPEHLDTRSQDLPDVYFDAAQFYWGRKAAWLANRPIFSSRSTIVQLPFEDVHDIDTPADLDRAKMIYEVLRK